MLERSGNLGSHKQCQAVIKYVYHFGFILKRPPLSRQKVDKFKRRLRSVVAAAFSRQVSISSDDNTLGRLDKSCDIALAIVSMASLKCMSPSRVDVLETGRAHGQLIEGRLYAGLNDLKNDEDQPTNTLGRPVINTGKSAMRAHAIRMSATNGITAL